MSSKSLERNFKTQVKKRLDAIPGLYYFVKEAKSIRGIADIIGCTPNGRFFAWELKKDRSEVRGRDGTLKLSGRTKLQFHTLGKIRRAGGIGEFVYPQNLEKKLAELTASVYHSLL